MTPDPAADSRLAGRIGILGSGREGLAAFDYITALGSAERVEIITEGLTGREREAALQAAGSLKVCPFGKANLASYDLLVRSPGVSVYRQPLQDAKMAGVRITTPSSIWFDAHPDARTIVITGTKGKSTTASLLTHMLAHMAWNVRLAGNIGTPLIACRDDAGVDWWVIELSSFQITDLEASPTMGILLNLSADHLDWHGDAQRYHRDKLRLAALVGAGGLLANRDDAVLRAALQEGPEVKWFSASDAADIDMPVALPGKHNRSNLSACLAAIEKLGLDRGAAIDSLTTFEGLPHRLQRIGECHGVRYIDDSISSAPVATVAALQALEGEDVVLLAGGFDRDIDWLPYAEALRANPPLAVVGMPDNGPRILAALEAAGVRPKLGTASASDLAEAVACARGMAPGGAIILLSPGAPSFPHFRDYEDRGAQFKRLALGANNPD